MKAKPKLGSTIYIEVAGDQAAPVFLAQSPLPLDWGHDFSNLRINQNALDIHLLFGSSYRASENHTLGRWRVSDIAVVDREGSDIQVNVRVNTQGLVEVTAALGDQPLNVFRLPGGSAKVPLVIEEVGQDQGDIEEVNKPADQGDSMSDEILEDKALPTSAGDPGAILECEVCGGKMEVRFVDEMRDKQLVCTYCGSEADIPDAYRRTIRKREHDNKPLESHTTESMFFEARRDGLPGLKSFEDSPGKEDLRELIEQGGLEGIEDEIIEALKRRGFDIPSGGKSSIVSTIRRLDKQNEEMKNKLPRGYIPLTPQEILELAGQPLPVEERRNCPNCEAVISRHAKQCPWCSVPLAGSKDG
jgi:hypothetical protein